MKSRNRQIRVTVKSDFMDMTFTTRKVGIGLLRWIKRFHYTHTDEVFCLKNRKTKKIKNYHPFTVNIEQL